VLRSTASVKSKTYTCASQLDTFVW